MAIEERNIKVNTTNKASSNISLGKKIATSLLNLAMAILAIVPLIKTIYLKVQFTFEMNDDAALMQVLDGSYTGTPDGHSIFVRYPLSGIIADLYEKNPTLDFLGIHIENANWYVTTFVIVTAIAMIAVLFRLLCYVGRFRIALCILFDVVFLYAWLPHFANMTFSTAAGFLAVMGMLFFGLERAEEAWRPWNILVFAGIMICAYSFREQCFLMVLPIIAVETVLKFGIGFFKSWKPWVCVILSFGLVFGAMKYDDSMYGSDEWQQYLKYNSMRSHLQDYVGYPKYAENEDFYKSVGISENELYAMQHYSYSMVEGYSQDTLIAVYEYVHEQEEEVSLKEQMLAAKPKALEYFEDTDDCTPGLVNYAKYLWMLALGLLPLSILWFIRDIRRRIWGHLANLIALGSTLCIVAAEWVYLAIDARFPDRVEEVIRVLTLYAGFYVAMRILGMWNYPRGQKKPSSRDTVTTGDAESGIVAAKSEERAETPLWKHFFNSKLALAVAIVLTVAECGLLAWTWNTDLVDTQIDNVIARQEEIAHAKSNKAAVIRYCGEHLDKRYVLDTTSVTDGTRPGDDLHQGNWFMSGSWMNLSPVYYEKLAANDTDTLGYSFVSRDDVYIITKGERNVAKKMGYMDKNAISVEIADRFTTELGTEFIVYKVR